MKQPNWVGVDVGSRELVVAVERNGKRSEAVSFENTAEGHRKLIHFITRRGASARVVLESTGVYGFDLALALDRASRVEVMVANPGLEPDRAGSRHRRRSVPPYAAARKAGDASTRYFLRFDRSSSLRVGGSSPSRRAGNSAVQIAAFASASETRREPRYVPGAFEWPACSLLISFLGRGQRETDRSSMVSDDDL